MTDTIDDLPGVLGEIAGVIGMPAALDLAKAYGGRTIYLPSSIEVDHPLARSIGYEAALSLVHAYGRGELLVPMGPTGREAVTRRHTAREIARMNEDHQPATAIARAVGVHERTVFRHRARHRPDPNQPGLFDDYVAKPE